MDKARTRFDPKRDVRNRTVEQRISAEYLTQFLNDANKISQGEERIVYAIIDYFKSITEGRFGVEKAELFEAYAKSVVRRRDHGHHLTHDSQGGVIDDARIQRHARLQVERLLNPRTERFNMKRFLEMILEQDRKWQKDERHNGEKFSLLLKILRGQITFNTPEVNELCQDINDYLRKNWAEWKYTLQEFE